jgi:hypothetical protein
VTLNEAKSLLHTPKYLKTLVMEEMKIIKNGEDPNSNREWTVAEQVPRQENFIML